MLLYTATDYIGCPVHDGTGDTLRLEQIQSIPDFLSLYLTDLETNYQHLYLVTGDKLFCLAEFWDNYQKHSIKSRIITVRNSEGDLLRQFDLQVGGNNSALPLVVELLDSLILQYSPNSAE